MPPLRLAASYLAASSTFAPTPLTTPPEGCGRNVVDEEGEEEARREVYRDVQGSLAGSAKPLIRQVPGEQQQAGSGSAARLIRDMAGQGQGPAAGTASLALIKALQECPSSGTGPAGSRSAVGGSSKGRRRAGRSRLPVATAMSASTLPTLESSPSPSPSPSARPLRPPSRIPLSPGHTPMQLADLLGSPTPRKSIRSLCTSGMSGVPPVQPGGTSLCRGRRRYHPSPPSSPAPIEQVAHVGEEGGGQQGQRGIKRSISLLQGQAGGIAAAVDDTAAAAAATPQPPASTKDVLQHSWDSESCGSACFDHDLGATRPASSALGGGGASGAASRVKARHSPALHVFGTTPPAAALLPL